MIVSRFQGRWTKNAGGPITLNEALEFAKRRGVALPDDVEWFVAEHEGFTIREAKLENEDARYFRFDIDYLNIDAEVKWNRLTTRNGTIPVFLRSEVLESEEHALYVIAHEVFELTELKIEFPRRGGSMTYRAIAFLIEPELDGAIHENAVRRGDELVRRLREERGIET